MAVGVNIVSRFNSKGIADAIIQLNMLKTASAKSGYALNTMNKAAGQMAKVFAKVGLGAGIVGGLAVKQFAQFDDAMTQSLAIMGDVSDAMRSEMTEAAKQMARETTFSATDAAKSFYYLASAGLSAEASVSALPKVAKFAQAGMFDMARATDLLTDAQSALGLTMRNDAIANMNNMVHVSDVLVKANTLANASVEQFSIALTNKAGPAMKSVGMDIEEGVAVLAAFADQGIKAEEGGTQFAIVLRELQRRALENTKAFKKYNVTVFDNAGEMRNMGDILGDLDKAYVGLSDAQRKSMLSEMGFADRSVISLLALKDMSGAVKTYEEQLREASGTTEEVAKKQLTSLSSQLKLARNAIQELAISLGQYLAPMVRSVALALQQFRDIVGEDGVGSGLNYLVGRMVGATFAGGAMGKTFATLVSLFVALRVATVTYNASMAAMRVITTLTDGAVKALVVSLGAEKIAMVAAGSVVALLAVAATAYMVYAKRKADAQKSTLDFISALKLEGETQDEALLTLYKSDKNWRAHIDTMGVLGIKMDEANGYISSGRGQIADLAKVWDTATAGVQGIYPQLEAFAKAMGLTEGTTYSEIAAIRNMITAMVGARDETANNIDVQIGLAKAIGNTILAAELLARKFGLDPTIPLLRKNTSAASDATAELEEELRKLLDGMKGVGNTAKTVTDKLKDYKDSVKSLNSAKLSLIDASQGVIDAEQKVKDSVDNTADALRNISRAQHALVNANKSSIKATKAVGNAMASAAEAVLGLSKAQDKLKVASETTMKAQQALDEAVNGYGKNSKQGLSAQDALVEAQLQAEGVGYDLEKAQYAVIDAETELATVRKDSTSTSRAIRQAEIDLAEAKISLIEKQRDQLRITSEVTTATDEYDQMVNGVKSDSEIYKDLLTELNEAKAQEAEATNAVTDAMKEQVTAQEAINDALDAEAEAKLGVEEAEIAVTKAKKEFAKAQLEEAQATRDVARARLNEAEATIAQAEAQERLNRAKKDAGKKIVATGNKQLAPYVAIAQSAIDSSYAALDFGNMFTPFATGGVVTSPTRALIGERGPEAVIPLDRLSTGGGSEINITVNAGMGTDGTAVGNAVVDALIKYQRRNGAIPITVKN